MKICSSYKIKINSSNTRSNIFKPTIDIYRKAVKFYIKIINDEWDTLAEYTNSLNAIIRPVELLSHQTKNNPKPKYNFDTSFYKFPCYLRRAAIMEAAGIVSSYHSNYNNWVNKGKQGNEPRLQINHGCTPPMYYNNMFEGTCTSENGKVKIFYHNDWVYYPVSFRKQDIEYIQKYWSDKKVSAPVLESRHGVYYLRFVFTEYSKLNNTPVNNQRVLAVDLGINNNAVCSVVDANGTVYSRDFINQEYEKDHLYHQLNKLKKFQRQHGSKNSQSQWLRINNINSDISRKTAKQIISLAVKNNADCIVFEYLDIKGKIHGSKAQQIALWRKKEIQNIVEHQAHRQGIRISRINPSGTSKYAFDGSGEIERNNTNYSLCKFATGKQYNCDLNASYNIGARYFIRELLKPLPETERSQMEAKVPSLAHRTCCTLSSLISLADVLKQLAA